MGIDLGLCVPVALQIIGCITFFASVRHYRHAVAHKRIVDAAVRIGRRPRSKREQADQQQLEESRKHGLETNNLERACASGATHKALDTPQFHLVGSGRNKLELAETVNRATVTSVIRRGPFRLMTRDDKKQTRVNLCLC
ncbi:hypothetical protein [Xanthomonas arboricola]|uniref:hypothetical protein n=1 Tax=Xanthomonas arboricola TaxID=56448 RepID=UPI002157A699|nr:hypothetical protein [Xanthomonas arboricola]